MFDFPGVTMGGVCDFFKGEFAFFCGFCTDYVFDEHGADDCQFDFGIWHAVIDGSGKIHIDKVTEQLFCDFVRQPVLVQGLILFPAAAK